MIVHGDLYGLPTRPQEHAGRDSRKTWGRERRFPWDHALPGLGKAIGGIGYIPSLDLMFQADGFGKVNIRNPLTTDHEVELTWGQGTDYQINCCHVPSCDKLVFPIYLNGSGGAVAFLDLKTGRTSALTGLTTGTYDVCYCPINDLCFMTAWQGPTVYVIDPWTEALHTTSTVSGTIGGIPLGICFCPLNGKVYTVSRSANTIVRINPLTFAVEASTGTAGGFDLCFYSDNMQKIVISAASGAGLKTSDPLNSDTVAQAMNGWSGLVFSGVSVPTTNETVIIDTSNSAIRFLDPSATLVTSITNPRIADLKYCGWNPVTKQVWVTQNGARALYAIDPIERTYTEYDILRQG